MANLRRSRKLATSVNRTFVNRNYPQKKRIQFERKKQTDEYFSETEILACPKSFFPFVRK